MNKFKTLSWMVLTTVMMGIFTSVSPGQQMPSGNMTGNPQIGQDGYSTTTRPAGINPKMQATQLLTKGRAALQQGNLDEATHFVRQANMLVATYGPNEDSPQRLWADIQAASEQQNKLVEAPVSPAVGAAAGNMATNVPAYGNASAQAVQNSTPSPQAIGARNQLLVNARVALSQGDVRRAWEIAQQAAAMKLPYPQKSGDTHELVMTHIKNYDSVMKKRSAEGDSETLRRILAKSYIEQSQMLLGWGRLEESSSLAYAAENLNVKLNQFEAKPRDILARIEKVRTQRAEKQRLAGSPGVVNPAVPVQTPASVGGIPAPAPASQQVIPAQAIGYGAPVANPAIYSSAADNTKVVPSAVTASPGVTMIQQANIALQQGKQDVAARYLAEAERYRAELSPTDLQRLNEMKVFLATPSVVNAAPVDTRTADTLNSPGVDGVLLSQLATEIQNRERKSQELRSSNPDEAIKLLVDAKKIVESSQLQPAQRDRLQTLLDGKIADCQKFIEDNKGEISLRKQNETASAAVKSDYDSRVSRGEELASMVDEFNRLLDERRFAEAAVLGKKAKELYPKEVVAIQMEHNGRSIYRTWQNMKNRNDKADLTLDVLHEVDVASQPFPGEIQFPENWAELSKKRKKYAQGRQYSEQELKIKAALDTPIQPTFQRMPLNSVIDFMSKATGVNIHLDPAGLAEEGVSGSDPVTLTTQNPISLKSALDLILKPIKLEYTIRNEVLLITSKARRDTDVYTQVYPVADLVIPIPNFSPSSSTGLEGALRNAISMNRGDVPAWAQMMAPSVHMARKAGSVDPTAMVPPATLAQMSVPVGGSASNTGGIGGFGTGGMATSTGAGGAASADFDSLIELIRTTVRPDSWTEPDSGEDGGTIAAYPTNLSLVVRQTQEIHEEIIQTLEQLRRMQDLQVTIEVRFITLSDTFFEKIGVDFNVNIPTKTSGAFNSQVVEDDDGNGGTVFMRNGRSATVGQNNYYNDWTLDSSGPAAISFLQNSSALTTAGAIMGSYDATANYGAQLGFAILSDVEAYMFLDAAQSTERSNILQAPKVTLFNGQQAYVADTSQTPFVISVTPVVGDFAAALQPVIVVLSEGTFMTVQAVVSPDRRFVRLTVVPYFSEIGQVNEFTFTGSTTTTRDTSAAGNQDEPDDNTSNNNSESYSRQGTTVQLPTFSYVTVTTTVSVPDGGTVLLGGIKRLNEGRSEAGVPILNKVPFLNRLFKNTSIGRETSSLMMVVTPRIIIQEEEEENIGVNPTGN